MPSAAPFPTELAALALLLHRGSPRCQRRLRAGDVAIGHRETVFGLFDKIDARSEGTGVGLALVRRITGTHGGRVWVESESGGRGACLCFTLPAAERAGARVDAG